MSKVPEPALIVTLSFHHYGCPISSLTNKVYRDNCFIKQKCEDYSVILPLALTIIFQRVQDTGLKHYRCQRRHAHVCGHVRRVMPTQSYTASNDKVWHSLHWR